MEGAETVIVAVPAVMIVVVDIETFSPAGNVELTKVTGPANPDNAVTVTVDEHDEPPTTREISDGLVETSKSGPFTRTGTATVAL